MYACVHKPKVSHGIPWVFSILFCERWSLSGLELSESAQQTEPIHASPALSTIHTQVRPKDGWAPWNHSLMSHHWREKEIAIALTNVRPPNSCTFWLPQVHLSQTSAGSFPHKLGFLPRTSQYLRPFLQKLKLKGDTSNLELYLHS